MCGIVGILGNRPVAGALVDALRRLEYRGYDSAGIATLDHGRLDRRRAEGKLVALEKRLDAEPLAGNVGIGHTRWATHGRPTESNAHPHATAKVAVVHNGIIENFRELRESLIAGGRQVLQRDRYRGGGASGHPRNGGGQIAGRCGRRPPSSNCAAPLRSHSCSPARTI